MKSSRQRVKFEAGRKICIELGEKIAHESRSSKLVDVNWKVEPMKTMPSGSEKHLKNASSSVLLV
ncbi:hypothetical protein SDJN02_20432, partial [Cucurbita argyrosperma subsp. argyrosperma]